MLYILEAFNGVSHKQLVDLLQQEYNSTVYALSAKKWHWKMRTGGLQLAMMVDANVVIQEEDVLFATSTFNLTEFLALRPQFAKARKILYFHENQLNYPTAKEEERDFQFGWNQLLSCLVADVVVFNSHWNMKSFLNMLPAFVNKTPDKEPKNICSQIESKCSVLYFPLQLDEQILCTPSALIPLQLAPDSSSPIHIVWNHRWEHDKDPTTFFSVLFDLHHAHIPFSLSVLGQSFEETPEIFAQAQTILKDHILHFGFMETKETYFAVLRQADVCVSTAIHEFFGVSVIEAALLGCYCICPNRLSYPELFERKHLYNTQAQLRKQLKDICLRPDKIRSRNRQLEGQAFHKYLWSHQKQEWDRVLCKKDSVD